MTLSVGKRLKKAMQTYLLTIYVTVEQEDAIQQLYVEKGWLFNKTSATHQEKSAYLNYQNSKEANRFTDNSKNGTYDEGSKPYWHEPDIKQTHELQNPKLLCDTKVCQKDGSGSNLSSGLMQAECQAEHGESKELHTANIDDSDLSSGLMQAECQAEHCESKELYTTNINDSDLSSGLMHVESQESPGESKELNTANIDDSESEAGFDTTLENYRDDNETLETNRDFSDALTKNVANVLNNNKIAEENEVCSNITDAEANEVIESDESKHSINTKTHEITTNCGAQEKDEVQGFNHSKEIEISKEIKWKEVFYGNEKKRNDCAEKSGNKNSSNTMKITRQKTDSGSKSRPERVRVGLKEYAHRDKESLKRKAKSRQKKFETKPQRKEKRGKCKTKSKDVTTKYKNNVTERNNEALKEKVPNGVQKDFKTIVARDKHKSNNKIALKEIDGNTSKVHSDENSFKIKQDSNKIRDSKTHGKEGKAVEDKINSMVGSRSQNNYNNGNKLGVSDSDSTVVEDTDTETSDSKAASVTRASCKKNGEYLCKYCKKVFLTELPYRKHIERHEEHAFDCPECGKKFSNRRNLNSHMFQRTRQRTFNCDNCSFVTTTACLLRIHKKETHQKKIIYQCHLCAKIVKTKSYLNVHLKYSHNIDEGKYLCPFCGQKSKRPKLFAKHLKEHMNDADCSDRQCSVCRKIFKTKKHLRSHRRVHKEKAHLCDFCGKGFTTRTKLEAHNRTHTGVKPYKCKLCDYKSAQSGNIRLHMKVHEKEESKKQQLEETANLSAEVMADVNKNENENVTETNYSTKACANSVQNVSSDILPTVSETFSRNTLPSYMDYLQSSGNMSSLATAASTLTHTGLDKDTNIHADTMPQTYTDVTYNTGNNYNSVYQPEHMTDSGDIEKARYPTDRVHSSQLSFDSSDLFNSAPTHNTSQTGINSEYSQYPRSYASNHTMYAAEHAEHIPDHTLSDTANLNRQSSAPSQLCSQFSNLPEAMYPNTQADEYSSTAPLPPSDSQPGMFGISRTDLETATQAYSDNFDIDYNATVQSIYDSNQSFDEDRNTDNIETTSSSRRSPLVWVYTVCNF